jgi:hypothetical protein
VAFERMKNEIIKEENEEQERRIARDKEIEK